MKLSATVKEAVAPPKRVLALPDLEHAKTAVLNSLTIRQRPANLRPRDSRVRHLVLF